MKSINEFKTITFLNVVLLFNVFNMKLQMIYRKILFAKMTNKIMSEFSQYFNLWKCNNRLKLYFDQICSSQLNTGIKLYKEVVQFFLSMYNLIPLFLIFNPMSIYNRLLFYDLILLLHLPQSYNWLMLFYATDASCFQHQMFKKPTKSLLLIREILYSENVQKINFFVQKTFINKNGAVKYSVEIIRKTVLHFLNIVKYFTLFAASLCSIYRFSALLYIFKDIEYYFFTLNGYLSLLVIFINSFYGDFMVLTYVILHNLWGVVTFAFTLITFLQFRQVNQILVQTNPLTYADLRKFTKYHTKMLSYIFQFNIFFGSLLLFYIATNMPISSFIFMGIILGKNISLATKFVFVNFLFGIFTLIIFMHLLGAAYSNKIHKSVKMLFHWTVQKRICKKIKMRFLLCLYLEKFNNSRKKRYGISYGRYFGLMSFSSFFQVCF